MGAIMDKLKVFISSSNELNDERLIVKEIVEDLNWIPILYENWKAKTESMRTTYIKGVKSSDVYVGIFWRKYSQPTIEEYETANVENKEISIHIKSIDKESRDNNLVDFINKIKDKHVYNSFKNILELKNNVKRSISESGLKFFEVRRCGFCDGIGKVPPKLPGIPDPPIVIECNFCKGEGINYIRKPTKKCDQCNGSGKIIDLSKIRLPKLFEPITEYMNYLKKVLACTKCNGKGWVSNN